MEFPPRNTVKWSISKNRSPKWFSRLGFPHMIWKEIPGFQDYLVSEHGDVKHGVKHLKPERTYGNGRKRFSLSKGGRIYRFKAYQLVALAFIGPPPFEGAQVCHKDDFFHNNHYSNLCWGTQKQNAADLAKNRLKIANFRTPRDRQKAEFAAQAKRIVAS